MGPRWPWRHGRASPLRRPRWGLRSAHERDDARLRRLGHRRCSQEPDRAGCRLYKTRGHGPAAPAWLHLQLPARITKRPAAAAAATSQALPSTTLAANLKAIGDLIFRNRIDERGGGASSGRSTQLHHCRIERHQSGQGHRTPIRLCDRPKCSAGPLNPADQGRWTPATGDIAS